MVTWSHGPQNGTLRYKSRRAVAARGQLERPGPLTSWSEWLQRLLLQWPKEWRGRAWIERHAFQRQCAASSACYVSWKRQEKDTSSPYSAAACRIHMSRDTTHRAAFLPKIQRLPPIGDPSRACEAWAWPAAEVLTSQSVPLGAILLAALYSGFTPEASVLICWLCGGKVEGPV